MKKITVYADFDFLSAPQEVGTLGYEHVRGKDHFVFEYSRQWLKQHGGILLSGDLMNVPSLQHPRGNDNVFGFVKDSFPDRWGRLLLEQSIRDVTDPCNNSINEKCARIREAFVQNFDDRLAQNYYVTGKRGEPKRITLDKSMIIWE